MPRKSAKAKDPRKNLKVNMMTHSLVSRKESEYDSTTCTTILATRSEIGEEGEMREDAANALGQALQGEEPHVEDVIDELFVGNHRGRDFASSSIRLRVLKEKDALYEKQYASQQSKIASHESKIASNESKLASNESKLASNESKLASHESEIANLRNKLLDLALSSKGYKQLRNRFISTFRRDKLTIEDASDTKTIQEGNAVAHGGNAIVDATLYEFPEWRTDTLTFKILYGLSYTEVSRIKYGPTIVVLNTHASIISSKDKVGRKKFYESFDRFIELLKASGYDENYLNGGKQSGLKRAYRSFIRCANGQVRRARS